MRGLIGSLGVAGLLVSLGCGSEAGSDADKAVEAAKALMDVAAQAKEMGKAAEAAEQAAEDAVPEGASEEEAKQLVDNARAVAALQALGKGNGGAVTNWRQLEPFLPEKLGGYSAKGDLDGRTNKAGAMKVTTVSRSYEGDGQRINVNISDTAMNPMLRAPFAMAAMVEEDSTSGYRKGTKVDGHTAILEWDKRRKQSKATLLVADRFVVNVQVRDTDKDDAASAVVKAIDLGGLAKVQPDAAEAKPDEG